MRLSRGVCRLLVLGVTASVVLAVGASQAMAVIVDAYPTSIPSAVATWPPPIPALPAATNESPPASEIADPVIPAAVCGGWYQQSSYGGDVPTSSTWWEYRCSYEDPPCIGACNADYVPSIYYDYFYWDGARAVFYGELFLDQYLPSLMGTPSCAYWWDGPTTQWYLFVSPGCGAPEPANAAPTAGFTFSCSALSCVLDGSASFDSDGTIDSYNWTFGDGAAASGVTAQHTYSGAGTYTVTLTVTDNGGATAVEGRTITLTNAPPTAMFAFSCSGLSCTFDGSGSSDSDGTILSYGWSFGDGVGASGVTAAHTYGHAGAYSASLTVTDDGGASATVSKDIAVTNIAPTAAFTVTCSGLHCSLDGGPSSDSDGAIATYSWTFGDGAGGSGRTTVHDYPKAGNYTVTLTVTDNDGGSAVSSQRINPISLSARGYKAGGQKKVDLSWNSTSGTSFYLYRSGLKIATVQTTAYTDNVNARGSGSYTYKVCEAGSTTCSNDATVSFG